MALFTDDIAPADAVALNIEPSVFAGNVLREHLQAALRCRIGTDCLAASSLNIEHMLMILPPPFFIIDCMKAFATIGTFKSKSMT